METRGYGAIIDLQNLIAWGGIIALGSDYSRSPVDHQMAARLPLSEFYGYQEGNMSPMQIIVVTARNAAVACCRGGKLGTIETGKIADILIVNGDPPAEIFTLKKSRDD